MVKFIIFFIIQTKYIQIPAEKLSNLILNLPFYIINLRSKKSKNKMLKIK